MTKKPPVEIKEIGDEVFVMMDGVKIAMRAGPDSTRAGTWMPIEPGWTVLELDDVLALPGCMDTGPVTLACSGTIYGGPDGALPWTFSIVVDTEKKVATVDNYAPAPIAGDASKDTVAFMAAHPPSNEYGFSSGTLNRITGAASIYIMNDGLRVFNGTCKPAPKLF
jgi:hypothetical protein